MSDNKDARLMPTGQLPTMKVMMSRRLQTCSADARANPRLVVAVPSEGRVHPATLDSIAQMIRSTRRAELIDLWWESAYPAGYCRNRLVRRFLADPQWTHILLVDTDMVVPADGLDRLLEADVPMVSGPAPICARSEGSHPRPVLTTNILVARDPALRGAMLDPMGPAVPWHHVGLADMPDHPFTCDSTGLAFLLIRRDVLEGVDPPWFQFVEHADGSKLAPDTHFFRKARGQGYELTIHPKVVCDHLKPVDLTHIEDLLGAKAFRGPSHAPDDRVERTHVVVCRNDRWLDWPLAEVLLSWQRTYGDQISVHHSPQSIPLLALRDLVLAAKKTGISWSRLLLLAPGVVPDRGTLAALSAVGGDIVSALTRRLESTKFVYAFKEGCQTDGTSSWTQTLSAEIAAGPTPVHEADTACLMLSRRAVEAIALTLEQAGHAGDDEQVVERAAWCAWADAGMKPILVPITVSRWSEMGLLGLLQLRERELQRARLQQKRDVASAATVSSC